MLVSKKKVKYCHFQQYCCSVTTVCPTFCDPMDCSMPGFSVLHNLPEFAQIWAQWVSDAHLILCHSLLPLPSIFSSIKVFFLFVCFCFCFFVSSKLALHIRWPAFWSFSFNSSIYNGYSQLNFFRFTGLISLLSKGLSRVFSSTTIQKHQFFDTQTSLCLNSHICTWLLDKNIIRLYGP